MSESWGARYSIAMWLLLNIADWFITPFGKEINPIIRYLDPSTFLLYKTILPILVVVLLAVWGRLGLIKWLNIGMGVVVVWNAVVILAGLYAGRS